MYFQVAILEYCKQSVGVVYVSIEGGTMLNLSKTTWLYDENIQLKFVWIYNWDTMTVMIQRECASINDKLIKFFYVI